MIEAASPIAIGRLTKTMATVKLIVRQTTTKTPA
jgi:hypothetical protein